jgi:hypothetical protein
LWVAAVESTTGVPPSPTITAKAAISFTFGSMSSSSTTPRRPPSEARTSQPRMSGSPSAKRAPGMLPSGTSVSPRVARRGSC